MRKRIELLQEERNAVLGENSRMKREMEEMIESNRQMSESLAKKVRNVRSKKD